MAHLSVWLLGPFLTELDGKQVSGFRSDKVRALLSYLCVEAGRPWLRATLAYLLWPDLPEKGAQSNLRNALCNLRRVLGDTRNDPAFLLISRDTIQLNAASEYWLDVQAFLDCLSERSRGDEIAADPASIARLEQAVTLYRGDFLEGFGLASTPFEDWALVTREHLRQRLLQAVRLLAMAHAQSGDLEASREFTRRWLELEPFEEAAHRHMMRLLALRGLRSAAVTQFEVCRQTLSHELGIQPASETVDLYEQIRDDRSAALKWPHQPPKWPGCESRPPHPFFQFLAPEPVVATEPTLFVAREGELLALARALERAAAGHGGVCFVTGEPGSGKTALLAEFARRAVAGDPELLVAWGQCNAFTGEGDPYFPFTSIIRSLAGEDHFYLPLGGLGTDYARRLWRRLPATLDALLDHGPDLISRFISGAELLVLARVHTGVRPDRLKRLQRLLQQSAVQPTLPGVQQVALFEQVTRVLSALAHRGPLLLIVDDMQWIDPGSLDLLFHLARRTSDSKVLLLCAYRPEESRLCQEAEAHPLLDVIDELQRSVGDIQIDLTQSEGEAFVDALIDSEANGLSSEFRARLFRHTTGNPLFTIELLRGMQQRGEIRRDHLGRWVQGPRLDWDKLPARVEAVIASRFRHLSLTCRRLLTAASVEGEEFTAEVMADLLQEDVQQVCGLLSQEAGKQYRLVTAHAMRHVGGRTLALYRFRHTLFQIYLYQHLDVVEKTRLHGRVADKLEQLFGQSLDQFPEMPHTLAHHFEMAGMPEKAVRYYTMAGKYALRLSANRQAISHFGRALRLLQMTPATPERDQQELELQLNLGPPLTATRGWAPPELAAAYGRAQELLQAADDDPRLIPALWLLATYRLGRSEHREVDRLVERLSRLAERAGDPALLVLASLQVSPFYQGRFAEARGLLERAAAARDVEQQRSLALQYGMAPAVVGLAYLAECLCLLGFPDQAMRHMKEARELAEQVQHPMALCYAFGRSCWSAALLGDLEGLSAHAISLGGVAQKFGLANFTLAAQFFKEWAANQGGTPTAEGITAMREALEKYRATGTVLNRTAFLALFGHACSTAGQLDRGLTAIDESLALAEQTGELWFQAEAWRIKGELLRLQAASRENGEGALRVAETCFRTARQVAQHQVARWLELRAVVSLCHLRQSQSSGNGLELLEAIVHQLSEGLETADMRRAHTLLNRSHDASPGRVYDVTEARS